MTLAEEIQRGIDAQRLIEEPLLIEAFEKIEQEVFEAWRTSPVRDQEAREKLYLTQAMLTKLKLHLQSVMETGMLAATTAQQQSNRAAGISTLLD
jgi:hypothetical protein